MNTKHFMDFFPSIINLLCFYFKLEPKHLLKLVLMSDLLNIWMNWLCVRNTSSLVTWIPYTEIKLKHSNCWIIMLFWTGNWLRTWWMVGLFFSEPESLTGRKIKQTTNKTENLKDLRRNLDGCFGLQRWEHSVTAKIFTDTRARTHSESEALPACLSPARQRKDCAADVRSRGPAALRKHLSNTWWWTLISCWNEQATKMNLSPRTSIF